jgi:hypothetical protein
MNFFKKLLRRRKAFKQQPKQLRIDGIRTPLTPRPDEAEIAAQALLETMAAKRAARRNVEKGRPRNNDTGRPRNNEISESRNVDKTAAPHDAAYYRELGARVRESRQQEALMLMRYLAYAESQLAARPPRRNNDMSESRNNDTGRPRNLEMSGSRNVDKTVAPATIERELYGFQDCAEREGGELLRRWQHALAESIVRQMNASRTEDTEQTEGRSAADTTQ